MDFGGAPSLDGMFRPVSLGCRAAVGVSSSTRAGLGAVFLTAVAGFRPMTFLAPTAALGLAAAAAGTGLGFSFALTSAVS